ncbi:MAG: dihydrofolate reductase family protein [Gammaproteobacteria bacterium]|jgi:dihydrofolate reductase
MKVSVFVATSLDGFIARTNGELDWLPDDSDEDYGFQAFLDSVDALIMGRHTYEQVLRFGVWPYDETPVIVLSTGQLDIAPHLSGTVESMSASPQEVIERLAERGAGHVYVDGGQTIQGFLAAGLVQQFTVTRVPILLGRGIPLFGALPHDVRLHHVDTRAFPDGLVQSRYKIAN